jgi:hypothetical protein
VGVNCHTIFAEEKECTYYDASEDPNFKERSTVSLTPPKYPEEYDSDDGDEARELL